MKSSEKLFILLIFLFVILGIIISRIDNPLFETWYFKEDGIIEWLTVLALFISSMYSFYRVKFLISCRRSVFIVALIGMGFVCLFGVGEEISWGQRVFNFESPTFFKIFNSQEEINIHNLIIYKDIKINKIVFGRILGIISVLYFFILPFLYRKFKRVKNFVNSIAIPVPKWEHAACFLLLLVLCELITGHKKSELIEFGGCWIFTIMLLRPFNTEIFSQKSVDK